MADACIVCLGDLRTSTTDQSSPEAAEAPTRKDADDPSSEDTKPLLRNTRLSAKSIDADEEIIAHLLPCKHDLHNSCLKPWVERANSCPICRATFNQVELSNVVGGPVVDSYAVQDKVQEAEVDATMVIEDDELFSIEAYAPEPCVVCGSPDEGHEVMFCDGCDKAVHVFCAGYDASPGVWYCESCLADMERDAALPGLGTALRRRPRRRVGGMRRRPIHNDAVWARVWQEVSQRLDLDLDFPFDDETTDQQTEEQRREFAAWQRRFAVADRQGQPHRLRNLAAARLQPTQPAVVRQPESQDEVRAWNAFEKARESQEAPASVRRKRKSTASPVESQETEPTEQRQLKRPRLRAPRPPTTSAQPPPPESSHAAAQRAMDGSTFLSSLLQEVERKPISAGSPHASDQANGQYSPHDSSPVGSPTSSGYATPRALSVTPPPQRPSSPPLSSTIMPPLSPVGLIFSPFSPADASHDPDNPCLVIRRSRPWHPHDSPHDRSSSEARASSHSPTRNLSYSSKEEIQRMVKLALGSRYRDKEITKDQYTEINRDVSRRMYELVGDASALADQDGRLKWQGVADEEVRKAIAVLVIDAEQES